MNIYQAITEANEEALELLDTGEIDLRDALEMLNAAAREEYRHVE